MNDLLDKWRSFDARRSPPEPSPALDAVNELGRALTQEWDRGNLYGPKEPRAAKRFQKLRRQIWDEIKLSQAGAKAPNPKLLASLLEDMKVELYPFGGFISKGGRRLKQLIQMLKSVRASSGSMPAVYRIVASTLRGLGI
jgi:hypothetical protein